MKKEELLRNSSDWDTIERTIQSIIRRLDRQDDLSEVLQAIKANQELLLEDFKEYYPQIRQDSLDWLLSAQP